MAEVLGCPRCPRFWVSQSSVVPKSSKVHPKNCRKDWARGGGAHLQRVVGGEGDGEAAREELREGVAVVVQEEGVVAERRHAEADLRQVEEVLQRQALAQVDAVGDVLAAHQRAHQVVHVSRLPCAQGPPPTLVI